jgi:hypothetical protein
MARSASFLMLCLGLLGSSLRAAPVGTTPAGVRVSVGHAASFVSVPAGTRVVARPGQDRFLLLQGESAFAKLVGCEAGSPVLTRKGVACPLTVPTLGYAFLGASASRGDAELATTPLFEIRSPGLRIERCGMSKAGRLAMDGARAALETELGYEAAQDGPRKWLEVGYARGQHFLAALPAAAFPELAERRPLRLKSGGGPCDCFGEGACTVHDMINPRTGNVDETFCGEDNCGAGCHLNMD